MGLTPKNTFMYLFRIRLDIVSSWFSEEGPTVLKISFSVGKRVLHRLLGTVDPISHFYGVFL